MHNIGEKLSIYQQMLELVVNEIDRVKKSEDWDEASFRSYEERWGHYRNQIEKLSGSEGSTPTVEEEKRVLEQIVIAHQQLITYIQQKWDQVRTQVVSVKQNQSIVNAYYHVSRVNDVSYYFDEKQ